MPLFVQTDASRAGMGAVLFQQADHGERRIISYASAKFNKTEQKYHANEQEMLAVVWAVKKYRQYLEDSTFTLRTDSRAITWFRRFKDGNAKLTRWALLLQEFNFTVEHCPGRDNELADFLSRNPCDELIDIVETTNLERKLMPAVNVIHTLADNVLRAQRDDSETQQLRTRWQRLSQNGINNDDDQTHIDKYVVENDILYNRLEGRHRLFVPEAQRPEVLRFYHNHQTANHPGIKETNRASSQGYYWPNQFIDVKKHVNGCLICHSIRTRKQAAAPLRPHVTRCPWHTVSVDILGPYETTSEGFRYIISAMDVFSKWLEARAVTTATTKAVTKFLDQDVFSRWGYPRQIISDSGTQFNGAQWKRYCDRNAIEAFLISAHHQRANPVERRHQELKKALRVLNMNQPAQNWNRMLHLALFNLRTRSNDANGCTPAKALLGQELARPGEWHIEDSQPIQPLTAEERKSQRRRILDHQTIYRRRYVVEPLQAPTVNFRIGDLVMVRENRRTTSFAPPWTGPHPVVEVHGTTSYTIDRDGSHHKVHIDDLRTAP